MFTFLVGFCIAAVLFFILGLIVGGLDNCAAERDDEDGARG